MKLVVREVYKEFLYCKYSLMRPLVRECRNSNYNIKATKNLPSRGLSLQTQ